MWSLPQLKVNILPLSNHVHNYIIVCGMPEVQYHCKCVLVKLRYTNYYCSATFDAVCFRYSVVFLCSIVCSRFSVVVSLFFQKEKRQKKLLVKDYYKLEVSL